MPIEVTSPLIVNDVKFEHELSKLELIIVTFSGITIETILVHTEKAPSPIEVTLSGISIDFNFLQFEKARLLIIVSSLFNVTDFKLLQL